LPRSPIRSLPKSNEPSAFNITGPTKTSRLRSAGLVRLRCGLRISEPIDVSSDCLSSRQG
jgi:hypothetical protein